MKKKVIDLRTARGEKIFNNLKASYCSLDYGVVGNEEIIFSEGYTHVIYEDGKIINCNEVKECGNYENDTITKR